MKQGKGVKPKVYLASTSKKMEGNHCPTCGGSAEGGTSLDPERFVHRAQPGDYALCDYCGTTNVYGPDLMLRRPTGEDLAALATKPSLVAMLDLARIARRRKS